jgi:hypothetical protein
LPPEPAPSAAASPSPEPVRPSAPAAALPPVMDSTSPTVADSGWKTPVGLALGGTGLLVGLVGGLFQLNADERWRDVNLYYAAGHTPSQEQLPTVTSLRQQAESQQTLARAAFIASGAAFAGGVVFLLLDSGPDGARPPVAVRVSASPSSVGVKVLFP